jgi:hypothetical protein
MRYLVVAAHYTSSPLQEKDGELLRPEDLGLPAELCDALREWNEDYRDVIPLDPAGRSAERAEIEFLDQRGLQLANAIERSLPGGAKVGYYSEGESRYLKLA